MRSQLNNHSARRCGYKASEMILVCQGTVFDRGIYGGDSENPEEAGALSQSGRVLCGCHLAEVLGGSSLL